MSIAMEKLMINHEISVYPWKLFDGLIHMDFVVFGADLLSMI